MRYEIITKDNVKVYWDAWHEGHERGWQEFTVKYRNKPLSAEVILFIERNIPKWQKTASRVSIDALIGENIRLRVLNTLKDNVWQRFHDAGRYTAYISLAESLDFVIPDKPGIKETIYEHESDFITNDEAAELVEVEFVKEIEMAKSNAMTQEDLLRVYLNLIEPQSPKYVIKALGTFLETRYNMNFEGKFYKIYKKVKKT